MSYLLRQYRLGYSVSNKSIGLSSGKLSLVGQPFSFVAKQFSKNLQSILEILAWNEAAGIKMFRISAHVLPRLLNDLEFNRLQIQHLILENSAKCYEIAEMIESNHMRLTVHAPHTLSGAIPYHRYEILGDILSLMTNNKGSCIFHIGGNPLNADHFMDNIEKNMLNLRPYFNLFVENVDQWSPFSTMAIAEMYHVGFVYDIFHHKVYCQQIEGLFHDKTINQALSAAMHNDFGLPPKYHLSSQALHCDVGTHSGWIDYKDYALLRSYLFSAGIQQADIMIEAKGKELAVQHIIQKTSETRPPWSVVQSKGIRV